MIPLESKPLTRAGGGDPDWISEPRADAVERYGKLSMPTSGEEMWRYIDLDFDIDEFGSAEEPGDGITDDDHFPTLGDAAATARVVDGLATAIDNRSPATFTSLVDAVGEHPEELRSVFGTGIPVDIDKFTAAHHAFVRDGVFVHIPEKTELGAPMLVDVQAATDGVVSFPHVTVVLEPSSAASLIVLYRSSPDTVGS